MSKPLLELPTPQPRFKSISSDVGGALQHFGARVFADSHDLVVVQHGADERVNRAVCCNVCHRYYHKVSFSRAK